MLTFCYDFNQLPECHQKSFPLHQLVNRATSGSAVLDKVFMNVPTWYQIPVLAYFLQSLDQTTTQYYSCRLMILLDLQKS